MLSRPYNGWSNVCIGEFRGRGSYVTDVPMDCLISFINSLEHCIPASVFFDEEGSSFTLVASFDGIYVISERETTELISIDKQLLDLVEELINDIEGNLEKWILWQDFYDYSEEELKERRTLIINRLNKLKELIKEYEF